jgi:uncharacterized protein with PQ loop repeat
MKDIIAFIFLAVYAFFNIVAYLPQIIQLIKTKSAEDINLSTWLIWIFSSLCYIGYVILRTPEIGLLSIEFIVLAMLITTAVLTAYYKKKKKQN